MRCLLAEKEGRQRRKGAYSTHRYLRYRAGERRCARRPRSCHRRPGRSDDIAEVADTAVDLDLVVQELLEGGDVEDLVAGGLRSIDDELDSLQSAQIPKPNPSPLPNQKVWGERMNREDREEEERKLAHTFFVTFACLPLGPDFYKTMILAYCITPQPCSCKSKREKAGQDSEAIVHYTYCGWCHC